MKGFTKDGKFHPIKPYNKVRKSRDQKEKTQGVRKARYRHQEHAIQDLTKTKSYWNVVLENPRAESGTTTHIIELGKMANKDDVINALMRMQKDGHFMYFPKDLQPPYLHSIERLKRDPSTERQFPLSLKMRKAIVEGLDTFDFVILDQNSRWKLTHIVDDNGYEYFVFPDEDSAIEFGRQSIRDTASEYIPDKGTPHYDEYINLDEDELVEKIIEEQSDFGQRSELGAVAQSVAGYDGEFTEFSDGSIAFRISWEPWKVILKMENFTQ